MQRWQDRGERGRPTIPERKVIGKKRGQMEGAVRLPHRNPQALQVRHCSKCSLLKYINLLGFGHTMRPYAARICISRLIARKNGRC
jgi:hypothetical protein